MTDTATMKEHGDPKLNLPANFFVGWYALNGRWFPWRCQGVSPFGVLIAEVLLRRTRAEMVALAWPSLIEEYPDPAALAAAKPSDLFLKLKSLGFGHQRSQVLLDLATTIKEARTLSSQPSELMVLPHVGLYTAHAVACFGFGKRVPVVDLNVVRVISRIAGIEPVKDIRRGASLIWQLAWALLPEKQVPEHNYGLLDFAATICKSRSPKHGECSIATWCAYARCGAPGHSCEVMINE